MRPLTPPLWSSTSICVVQRSPATVASPPTSRMSQVTSPVELTLKLPGCAYAPATEPPLKPAASADVVLGAVPATFASRYVRASPLGSVAGIWNVKIELSGAWTMGGRLATGLLLPGKLERFTL